MPVGNNFCPRKTISARRNNYFFQAKTFLRPAKTISTLQKQFLYGKKLFPPGEKYFHRAKTISSRRKLFPTGKKYFYAISAWRKLFPRVETISAVHKQFPTDENYLRQLKNIPLPRRNLVRPSKFSIQSYLYGLI